MQILNYTEQNWQICIKYKERIWFIRKQSTNRWRQLCCSFTELVHLLWSATHFIPLSSGLYVCRGETCFQFHCSSSVGNVFSLWQFLRYFFFLGALCHIVFSPFFLSETLIRNMLDVLYVLYDLSLKSHIQQDFIGSWVLLLDYNGSEKHNYYFLGGRVKQSS